MSKRLFSAFEQKQLESNPNVNHVSDRSISYAADFKVRAVQENLSGKGPMAIFLDHGFDLKLFGSDKPGECLKRWRSVYRASWKREHWSSFFEDLICRRTIKKG
ncbi:hypothetical protein [Shouchella clausii]|uniref:hypothetical protein n=1 Tax=Shouchella clausii TaxID=79880 RepID=UPI0027028D39|nr:hypothetical protein [Shouchella clausii]MDO7266798.1 hypothetical protein [Shouchella clausii]MDO7286287.1 hypothetical protein [Shouchella clausii]